MLGMGLGECGLKYRRNKIGLILIIVEAEWWVYESSLY